MFSAHSFPPPLTAPPQTYTVSLCRALAVILFAAVLFVYIFFRFPTDTSSYDGDFVFPLHDLVLSQDIEKHRLERVF